MQSSTRPAVFDKEPNTKTPPASDPPIEVDSPGLAPVLVMGAYPIVLIVCLIVGFIVFGMYQWARPSVNAPVSQVQSDSTNAKNNASR